MADEVEVTWEDQQNINKFGRLNNRLSELKAEVAAAKVSLEDIREAENETLLSDDEKIKLLIGEVFLEISKDEAEQIVQRLAEEKAEEIDALEDKIAGIKKTLDELKVRLYAKFNDQINLEDGDN